MKSGRNISENFVSSMVNSSPNAIDRDKSWLFDHEQRVLIIHKAMLREGHSIKCVGVSYGMRTVCTYR